MKPCHVLPLLLILLGCGTVSAPYHSQSETKAQCVDGFINETSLPTGHSTDPPHVGEWLPNTGITLWDLWHAAQRDLSQQPIYYLDGHSEPPIPQAANEQPNCQRVVEVPAEKGVGFKCGGQMVGGCLVNGDVFVASYNAWYNEWEIENAILARLGKVFGR